MYLQQEITTLLNKDISQASNQEIYLALLQLVKQKAANVAKPQSNKFSIAFYPFIIIYKISIFFILFKIMKSFN